MNFQSKDQTLLKSTADAPPRDRVPRCTSLCPFLGTGPEFTADPKKLMDLLKETRNTRTASGGRDADTKVQFRCKAQGMKLGVLYVGHMCATSWQYNCYERAEALLYPKTGPGAPAFVCTECGDRWPVDSRAVEDVDRCLACDKQREFELDQLPGRKETLEAKRSRSAQLARAYMQQRRAKVAAKTYREDKLERTV